jgi:hypothetical protein
LDLPPSSESSNQPNNTLVYSKNRTDSLILSLALSPPYSNLYGGNRREGDCKTKRKNFLSFPPSLSICVVSNTWNPWNETKVSKKKADETSSTTKTGKEVQSNVLYCPLSFHKIYPIFSLSSCRPKTFPTICFSNDTNII